MYKRIKKIISEIDTFLYRKFETYKSTKALENIKEAQLIFSYLNKTGEESRIRFVGGCVRKACSGEVIDDIDLATTLKPDEIKRILKEKEGVKVIDTGISHGTITVILNKKKFEITTLRKDISTDGRHANVEFTTSWEEDASRRDFTINSIYSDIEGRIFNPVNGLYDLQNGLVNFIGSPEQRIQEDYLRILRYFRFFIQYSKVNYDQNVIKSIKSHINGLNKISNERIFDELKKIFLHKKSYSLFLNNTSKEIFLNIFPQIKYYKRLKIINNLKKNLYEKFDIILILGTLLLDQSNDYEYFCHKYKTSNNIKNRFKNISVNFESLKSNKFYSEQNIKKLMYLSNKDYVRDLLLFSLCINEKVNVNDIEQLLNFVNIYKVPKFPITGDSLKDYGYETGQILGKKLKTLEKKWIDNDFIMDKEILKKLLH